MRLNKNVSCATTCVCLSLLILLASCDQRGKMEAVDGACAKSGGASAGKSTMALLHDEPSTAPTPSSPTMPSMTPSPGSATAAVTYGQQIQPIMQSYCVSCHNIGTKEGGPELATYDQVKAHIDGIIMSIRMAPSQKGFMPKAEDGMGLADEAKQLTPAQINMFVAWKSSGMQMGQVSSTTPSSANSMPGMNMPCK